MSSKKPKDAPFSDAVNDPDTRAEYIRRAPRTPQHEQVEADEIPTDLQRLQWWTREFVKVITQSLQRMPYGIRYMARETLSAVKVSTPSYRLDVELTRFDRASFLMNLQNITLLASLDWSTTDLSILLSCTYIFKNVDALHSRPSWQYARDIRHSIQYCRHRVSKEPSSNLKDAHTDYQGSRVWRGYAQSYPREWVRPGGYNGDYIVAPTW